MRYSYWSNSALADWVRSFCGVKKPIAQTSKGWKEWRVNYKNNHKFVYWLTEEFFNKFQDFIYWPKDKLDNIYYAINARFKDRYYIASSDLNKWKYHEIDTRMLHCNFQILVDFVECEQASMSLWSSRKEGKNYGLRWYHDGWISIFTKKWRSVEAGLDHLNWAMSLVCDEDFFGNYEPNIVQAKEDGTFGTPTSQAISAKETYDLYIWWTKTRPARRDSFEASGCDKIYLNKRNNDEHDDDIRNVTTEKRECLDIMNDIDEQYEREDNEMLLRLINHRRCLWT